MPSIHGSAIVGLSPQPEQPLAGDAIGRTRLAGDQPLPLERTENAQCAVGQPPTFTREAIDFVNAAGLFIAAVNDTPALRQHVQHALFSLRNIHD